MIVEAGVTLAEAQAAAQRADRLFPLSLASEGSCTIGGNLSTNAGGVAVLAYGNARDLTTGLEVVLADGRIVERAVQTAQGQHRLRPEEPVHRRRGHARDHHRGGAEAVSQSALARHRLRRPGRPDEGAGAFGLARAALGQTVTSFELMPRIALDFVLALRAGLARSLERRAMPGMC